MRYEYIRIEVDLGDLSTLNRYGSEGWRVVATFDQIKEIDPRIRVRQHVFLLERAQAISKLNESTKAGCAACNGTGSISNGTDEMACGFCTGTGDNGQDVWVLH